MTTITIEYTDRDGIILTVQEELTSDLDKVKFCSYKHWLHWVWWAFTKETQERKIDDLFSDVLETETIDDPLVNTIKKVQREGVKIC